MSDNFDIKVDSEVGRLTGVIVHRPGQEVANMTPESAARALYSDILNLGVAGAEYDELLGVLDRRARIFQVRDLLGDVLDNTKVRERLVRRICEAERVGGIADELLAHSPQDLARVLIEGVPLRKDNLSRFLSLDRYSLPPLHNFFFTRDPAVVVGEQVIISRMASAVRGRETCIMEAIFDFHPRFSTSTYSLPRSAAMVPEATLEGGDVLVATAEILIVGLSARTSRQAIDMLIERCQARGCRQHILVQELPPAPESFIHLDMVFTLLDVDHCLVYEPVIMQTHHYDTVHIHIEGGRVVSIGEEDNLPAALARLGMDLKPISCGGRGDSWTQEREQWHSGANFMALAPGQIVGYGRNEHTLDELATAGFAVVPAAQVIRGEVDLDRTGRCVVTIEGSELARGGGGCRCMTMPIGREPLST